MEITPVDPGGKLLIQGYGRGSFKLADGEVRGSMLIRASRFDPWPVATPADIEAALDHLVALGGEVDILLVGTGAALVPLGAAARRALRAAGLGAEVMTTPAACRTYNVLVAEDRRVAAALLALPDG